jgi:hypothetical protein
MNSADELHKHSCLETKIIVSLSEHRILERALTSIASLRALAHRVTVAA